MGNTFQGWTAGLSFGVLTLSGCMTLAQMVNRDKEGPESTTAISSPAEVAWTSTTWEAASTPRHRKMLERARAETITGEVVDVSCFLQLGKRGDAHVSCGQKCVRNGQPLGIVTDEGRLYLVIPEEHHPRRDGQVSVTERFAELMAQRVQVSGMVTEYKDYRAIFVRTLAEEPPAQP